MISNRAFKPYPVAALTASLEADRVTVEWANRSRLDTQLRRQSDPTATPEPGQVVRIEVFDENDDLIHTEEDVEGSAWDYLNSEEESDAGDLQLRLRFRVTAVRESYESVGRSFEFFRSDAVYHGEQLVQVGTDTVIV